MKKIKYPYRNDVTEIQRLIGDKKISTYETGQKESKNKKEVRQHG